MYVCLLPSIAELAAYIYTANPDIIIISESWLKKAIPNTAVSIPGQIRQDRIFKGRGGDSLFIVRVICNAL